MIRVGRPGDLQQMVELGYRLCDRTPYAHIPRDRPSIVRTFTQAMSSALGCAFVSEHEGKLTGLLIGVAQELWWSRMRFATDLVFYAERAGAGVLLGRQFLDWAWNVPRMVDVTMGQSSGLDPERSAAIYRRLGLQRVGGLYCAVKPAFAKEGELCQAS